LFISICEEVAPPASSRRSLSSSISRAKSARCFSALARAWRSASSSSSSSSILAYCNRKLLKFFSTKQLIRIFAEEYCKKNK
jgi:hypothetical protein